jgi:hypothetical protein
MSTQNAGAGSGQSVGVGPENDSRDHSQRASGGSGGDQLTRSLDDTGSGAPSTSVDTEDAETQDQPEGAGSATTAATRGPQDTHSHQAGSTATGLGVPETGANQQPGDLAPPSK